MEWQNQAVIVAQNLDVYQKKVRILSDVNLQINRGEFVYLIGKTGTGKSSLLRTFYADIPVSKGEAQIAGFDLLKLKQREIPYLRRKLGIVFQDFQLLIDRNVYDNLAFVLKATEWKDKQQMDLKIQEVLDKVNMGTQAYKMPYQLSGG
ncbi:MAG: ATP-binding cassette domain-containing protein, partial [Bacteroidales bacterium]